MGALYLALFCIGIYFIMTVFRKWADSFVMIAFAIGCVVNANIFTALVAPIKVGSIIFGVDSILITMFFHLVAVKYLHYPLKDCKLFIASSLWAIIISAFIEFFTNTFYKGFDVSLLQTLIGYFVSCLSIILAISIMIPFLKKMDSKKKSRYLSLPLGIVVANIINTFVYYFLATIILDKSIEDLLSILGGSIIEKTFATLIGLLCYFISSKWGHKDIGNKYLNREKQQVYSIENAKETDFEGVMFLFNRYRHYFPGLETNEQMNAFSSKIQQLIAENRLFVVRIENEIAAVSAYSIKHNCIAFLLVDERYRNQGIGSSLLNKCLEHLDLTKSVRVSTYLKDDYRAPSAWSLCKEAGFKLVENDFGNSTEAVFEYNKQGS